MFVIRTLWFLVDRYCLDARRRHHVATWLIDACEDTPLLEVGPQHRVRMKVTRAVSVELWRRSQDRPIQHRLNRPRERPTRSGQT